MDLNSQQWQAFIAVFVPLLVGFLKRASLPNVANAAIAIAVYVVAGLVAVLASGQPFNLSDITGSVAIFVSVGTVAYTAFWRAFESTSAAARLNLGSGPKA